MIVINRSKYRSRVVNSVEMSCSTKYRLVKGIIFACLVAYTLAVVCDDVDKSLCSLMNARIPGMCSDSCMSKFCNRTCGFCPLTCYECPEVDSAANCKTLKTCSSKDQYCFTAQTFTISFSEAYRLGCGPIKTCLQFSSGHNRGMEAGCCNQDKCNNKPPPLLKIDSPLNQTQTVPTRDPSFCVNLDDDVCTRLALIKPHLCADDCIATKLCPHMCKKCFYCLDCDEVNHPDNCTENTACGFGKQCYGFEKIGSNFKPAVQLGCIDSQVCELLKTPSGHIFGKRDKFTFEGGCCMGDWCNAHPNGIQTTPQSITTVTTPSPVLLGENCTRHHHQECPPGFKPIGKNCYLMGPDEKILRRDAEVFTSLKRDSFGSWIWESDSSIVNPQLIEHDFELAHLSCASAYISYLNGTNGHVVYTYGLAARDCDYKAVPLCYIGRGW